MEDFNERIVIEWATPSSGFGDISPFYDENTNTYNALSANYADGKLYIKVADSLNELRDSTPPNIIIGTEDLLNFRSYLYIGGRLILSRGVTEFENIQSYALTIDKTNKTASISDKRLACNQNINVLRSLSTTTPLNDGVRALTSNGDSIAILDTEDCSITDTSIDNSCGVPIQLPDGSFVASIPIQPSATCVLNHVPSLSDLEALQNLTPLKLSTGTTQAGVEPRYLIDPLTKDLNIFAATASEAFTLTEDEWCGNDRKDATEACDGGEFCTPTCNCEPGTTPDGTNGCTQNQPDPDPAPTDVPDPDADVTPDESTDTTDSSDQAPDQDPDQDLDTDPDEEIVVPPVCNNNGTCDPGETTTNCPQDCKQISQECLDNVRLVISVAEGDCDITHCEFDPVTGYNVIYSGSGQELCRLLGTEEGKDTPWNLSAILREGDKTLDIMLEIKDITSKGFKSANINKLPGIGYSISKSGHNLIGKLCNNNICLRTGSEGSIENSYAYEDGEDLVMVLESIQSTWWAYLENKDDGRTFDLPDTPETFTTEYRVSKKVFDALVADQPIIEVVENILDQGEDIGAEVAESGNGGGEDCGCNVRNPNKANHAGAILLLLVLLYVGAIKPGKKKSEQ